LEAIDLPDRRRGRPHRGGSGVEDKPAGQWTEEDIQQVLAASPWVKEVRAVVTRRLTEEQLRDGGQMGQPVGVGNEGVDPKGSGAKVSAISSPAPEAPTAAPGLFPGPSH
jgi:hypothetical protein